MLFGVHLYRWFCDPKMCVIIGSVYGDLSEGPDQCSRHQDIQPACHDWQSYRWLHRDILGIWR